MKPALLSLQIPSSDYSIPSLTDLTTLCFSLQALGWNLVLLRQGGYICVQLTAWRSSHCPPHLTSTSLSQPLCLLPYLLASLLSFHCCPDLHKTSISDLFYGCLSVHITASVTLNWAYELDSEWKMINTAKRNAKASPFNNTELFQGMD